MMKTILLSALFATASLAQGTFSVTAAPIPPVVIEENYGKMPKGIAAYDLNICNSSATRQAVVSGEVYQAMVKQNPTAQPVGRQIMLASILRNQNRSVVSIVGVTLNAATSVMSVLSSSKNIPSGVITASALGSLSLQQVVGNVKPLLPADKLEKFESQVLEPALVLDSGSCVERTVFTTLANPKAKPAGLSFHVR